MTPRSAFVAGATGHVGGAVLQAAKRRNLPVIAHVRPKSASKLQLSNVAAIELSDPALSLVLSKCTTIIQTIGTKRSRFAAGDTYETSDIGTTRELIAAAKKAGTVDHFVLLTSVGAGAPRGAYLKAKAATEALVVESGLAYTIFRPSVLGFETGSGLIGAFTGLFGLKKYHPIDIADLAAAMVEAAIEKEPTGVALEGGPLWDLVARAKSR